MTEEIKNEEKKVNKKADEIAAIWIRTDKKGEKYVSIKIKYDDEMKSKIVRESELNFKAFKNKDKKEGDAKPDLIGYKTTQKRE